MGCSGRAGHAVQALLAQVSNCPRVTGHDSLLRASGCRPDELFPAPCVEQHSLVPCFVVVHQRHPGGAIALSRVVIMLLHLGQL